MAFFLKCLIKSLEFRKIIYLVWKIAQNITFLDVQVSLLLGI